jgi:hypothetical protein
MMGLPSFRINAPLAHMKLFQVMIPKFQLLTELGSFSMVTTQAVAKPNSNLVKAEPMLALGTTFLRQTC